MPRSSIIHDDRGRERRIAEPGSPGGAGEGDTHQLALDEHRRLRLAFDILRTPLRMLGATVIMAALGATLLVAGSQPGVTNRLELIAAGVLLLMIGFGAPIVLVRGRRRYRARLAQLPPLCAACGCDMAGVYPEGDGCAVCPRCMAAWRFCRGPSESRRDDESER